MEKSLDRLSAEVTAVEKHCANDALAFYEPPAEYKAFFLDLCRLYLDAADWDRQSIRTLVADKRGIQNHLVSQAYHCAEQLQKSRDADWLQLGLAATVLAETQTDYRDMLLVRAELYVIAEEAGLDPAPALSSIAGLDGFGSYAVVLSRRSGSYRVIPPEKKKRMIMDKRK
ncbi:MAG TPA: hypothetical protein PKW33_05390 [Anaerolineaceae bacterium]|nr:hypothetical protein [Anaerolineaceae bacterium]HPN50999.1 hypothetical protein [Anaerolineaceae bacterium]